MEYAGGNGRRYVAAGAANDFFKLLSLPRSIFRQFLEILDALLGLG